MSGEALRLSDGQTCQDAATNANGLFCRLHAKQAHGLYKGYKRRNAQLDAIDDEAPAYLKNSHVPLANDKFESIQDETVLRQVHSHLFEKYVLFSKVIDARKLHHKHFYPLQVDYGHQAYLDKLSSQRHTVLRALGMLEKRTAQVLYEKEKWFTWVRKVQETEEANGEKEQKKARQEAALFKRHMKNLQTRLEIIRQREEKKRQDAYLEDAYRERMSMSADEADDDGDWDPIEDAGHDKRQSYIDLIKHFLWMEVLGAGEDAVHRAGSDATAQEAGHSGEPQTTVAKSKKKQKAKGTAASDNGSRGSSDARNVASRGQKRLLAMQESGQATAKPDLQEPNMINIETEAEMRKRLAEGVKKNYDGFWDFQIVSALENPHETVEKTAPMTDDEIDSVVKDIREIKRLLFSRLILAQASMLPAAIRANSVEEFLNDADVAESDLRDICLKVADPTLQVIRDACADFSRGDEADDDEDDEDEDEDEDEDDDEDDESLLELILEIRRYANLHTPYWLLDKLACEKSGLLSRQQKKSRSRKTKVTICGKSIWNHASENAMSLDGWLQFSVMAKDCSLENAFQLCRNWAEFSDLNLLTLWQFFPAPNWVPWGSSQMVRQLQELGFFPYFIDFEAQQHSRYNQVSGRSHGRRQHDIIETRNIIVGHMKRNDPVTRRFLQYLEMRAGELLLLVRDGKTGRVVTAPPKQLLWTYRQKQGIGRASKNEYVNVLEVGPGYFRMLDILRNWRFGFDDYYDVFIWDFVPCQSAMATYNNIIHELKNARRITNVRGIYAHMEPLLRTLTWVEGSMRTRQVKAGEDVETLWDEFMDERNELVLVNGNGESVTRCDASEASASPYLFYNEANVLEDQILFPDELISNKRNVPFNEMKDGVIRIESGVLPSRARHLLRSQKAGMLLLQGYEGREPSPKASDDEEDGYLSNESDDEEDGYLSNASDDKVGFLWDSPELWESAIEQVRKEALNGQQNIRLQRTGLDAMQASSLFEERFGERLAEADSMELLQHERSTNFKEACHGGDLEPGSLEKYFQVQEKIEQILGCSHSGSTDWVWFVVEIMDWLQLRTKYNHHRSSPWSHSFWIYDLVQAFATMAMFFPGLAATEPVTKFLESNECKEFRNSDLFSPKQRAANLPDRRSPTSYKYRKPEFWAKWKEVLDSRGYFTDIYPYDWSLAIRPIIAHCHLNLASPITNLARFANNRFVVYRAGAIAPLHCQSDAQIIPGIATANTEPHRPDKLDLFINYEDPYNSCPPPTFPACYIHPHQWPVLLPLAQEFAKGHQSARFALLRQWSAPHFYPLSVGPENRHGLSFLDSAGRSWQWNFAPKDMPGSEFSAHWNTLKRLERLQNKFGDRVVSRGDLIFVMAEDAEELLKTCTAVTFAIQTKPWLREIDVWKSFIDVDLDFLESLDDFWLD
ncbi:hypothetical protein J3459_010943 [Metarhizium acridum]|nr:hypothetical protein J3459_010943 [Metarhizium acridum]